jgi:ABC-2 type transport system ATP-binding protein
VRVRFAEQINGNDLADLPGVTVLSRDDHSLSLQVEGEIDPLLKTLAHYHVADLESERPSLEEIFMAYYEEQ